MEDRINNLGDYNRMREDLQLAGGSIKKLYEQIGETAVAKASPKIFNKGVFAGCLITVGVIAIVYFAYEEYCILKDRKHKTENEPFLESAFLESLEAELQERSIEEHPSIK